MGASCKLCEHESSTRCWIPVCQSEIRCETCVFGESFKRHFASSEYSDQACCIECNSVTCPVSNTDDFLISSNHRTQKAFPRTESELRAAFDAVDDKNVGAIDFDEMRSMLKDFDPLYTEDDVKEILVSLDLNDDSGSVSWGEFKRIFGMAGEQVTTSPVRTEDKAAGKDN